MKQFRIFIFFLAAFPAYGQETVFGPLGVGISNITGLTLVKKENIYFKEYYEVMVEQLLDHTDSNGKKFQQRLFIGYNDPNAPTVMETDGYAVDYAGKPNFIDEPALLIRGNMIVVEHRFFGKSVPDTLDWACLTTEQASGDYHNIRSIFSGLLKGKWLLTGISKGGQAAITYKMNFPEETDAVIIYSSPFKKGLYDERIKTFFKNKSATPCGKRIASFQKTALKNKNMLLPLFEKILKEKKINPGNMKIETVLEYAVLEYSFSFWQKGFKCEIIPDSTASLRDIINELTEAVPPSFFSAENLQKLQPAFYMAYHQLGYYEYDIAPFKTWLQDDEYSNKYFAPPGCSFDKTPQDALRKFIKSKKLKNVIFIYGGTDPWSAAQPILNKKTNCLIFIAKDGNHYNRISSLTDLQQKQIKEKISLWLQLSK